MGPMMHDHVKPSGAKVVGTIAVLWGVEALSAQQWGGWRGFRFEGGRPYGR
jgi:hypothetical protein